MQTVTFKNRVTDGTHTGTFELHIVPRVGELVVIEGKDYMTTLIVHNVFLNSVDVYVERTTRFERR